MKTITTVLLAFIINGFAFGQVPNAFQYQSIVRDAANNVISNQNVNLKILILDNSTTGNVLYSETHSAITNEFGLINLQIGGGTILSGSFNSINWGVNNKYVRLELDPTGGNAFQFMGTSQLLSVPYALHAGSSGNGNNNYSAGNGVSISGNVITNSAPDQTVTINGGGSASVSGTYPNFVISSTDNVNDADSNPTNELQTISQSGTNVTLSNGGGTFSVKDGDTSLWKFSGNNIYRRYKNVGIGTNLPQYRLHLNDTLNDSKLNTLYSNAIGGSTANTFYSSTLSKITGTNGIQIGISGYSQGVNLQENIGVYGKSINGVNNYGVYGDGGNNGNLNVGVYGGSSGLGDGQITSKNYGVVGHASGNLEGNNYGLWGQSSLGQSKNKNIGVVGYVDATGVGANAQNFGALISSNGDNTISSCYGIYTEAAGASGNNSTNYYGIYSYVSPGTNRFSGYFDGNVQIIGDLNVLGNISKGGGTFKIDHPLDPYNKYLVHSFVESPEMMNIYSGNITTDSDSTAVVKLPDYFQAANKDFKYQLTVIGKFAQAIVFEEINNNSFVVKTSEANIKVSWQVMTVRADKYADKNRIIPEQDKIEKGTLLHPELFNEDDQKSEFNKQRSKRPTIAPFLKDVPFKK